MKIEMVWQNFPKNHKQSPITMMNSGCEWSLKVKKYLTLRIFREGMPKVRFTVTFDLIKIGTLFYCEMFE
jgi:hypothetical protein